MKYEHKDTSVRKPQKAGRCGTSQFVQILSQPNKLRHEVPASTSLWRLESQTLAFIFPFPQKGWKPAGLNPLKKGWLARVRGWLTVLEYLSQLLHSPFILCLVFSLYLFQKLGLNPWTVWSHSKLCFWLQREQYPVWLFCELHLPLTYKVSTHFCSSI